MNYGQRYACIVCDDSKMLPEHPVTGKLRVRTGCSNCGKIRQHLAVGRFYELRGYAG